MIKENGEFSGKFEMHLGNDHLGNDRIIRNSVPADVAYRSLSVDEALRVVLLARFKQLTIA